MLRVFLLAFALLFCTNVFAVSASTSTQSSRPLPTDTTVLNFASEAALASFSYGFNDVNQKLPLLAEYFATDAWQKYFDTLKKTGQIEKIIANQYIVRSSISKKASILASSNEGLDHTWLIQVPLFVQYVGVHDKVSGNILITMAVSPSPFKQKNGLEIKQFVVETVQG